MILGCNDLLAAFKGDSTIVLTGKIAANLACTLWLLLSAQETQTMLQKIVATICQSDHTSLRDMMSPPNYQEYTSGFTGMLLAILPAIANGFGLKYLKPE